MTLLRTSFVYMPEKIGFSKRLMLLALMVVLATTGVASAQTDVTSCQKISSPGYYILKNDILSGDTFCIIIESRDVVFDGNGHTIKGTGGGIAVKAVSLLSNVTVKNLHVDGWQTGISFGSPVLSRPGVNHGLVANNTVSNSTYGIYLYKPNTVSITDNRLFSNDYGIYLSSSAIYNTVSGNTISGGSYGIFLYRAGWNTISDNRVTGSTQGIYLYLTLENSLSGNNVSGNNLGMYLSSSNNDLIYNNLFNNTVNVQSLSSSSIWNVTETPGVSIVGGPYIGGNYWSKPDKTGFSDTCTDSDDDWICDLPYSPVSGQTDHLPLTKPIPVDGCTVITESGKYMLVQDIVTTSLGTCIDIRADSVVLDGFGHSILGAGNGVGVGAYSSAKTLSGVTVRNLVLTNFSTGIEFRNVDNGDIIGNTVANNTYGIKFTSRAENNAVNENNVLNNTFGVAFINTPLYSNPRFINNTISDNRISGNSFGIWAKYAERTIVSDNSIFENQHGVNFEYANRYNSISNNRVLNNNNYGVRVYGVGINIITSNTISGNALGVLIASSQRNNVSNNTFESNADAGVKLASSSYNTIINNTIFNNGYGIHLYYHSTSNTLNGNSISRNKYGIYLDTYSNENTVVNNTVVNNYWNGLRIYYSWYNTIYNNYFLNPTSASVYPSYPNTWHTSKKPGVSIIGSPYLGGNYWSKPDGTGFSDTCTDSDVDGICDLSYSLASNNIDRLPLARYIPATPTPVPTLTPVPTPVPEFELVLLPALAVIAIFSLIRRN